MIVKNVEFKKFQPLCLQKKELREIIFTNLYHMIMTFSDYFNKKENFVLIEKSERYSFKAVVKFEKNCKVTIKFRNHNIQFHVVVYLLI